MTMINAAVSSTAGLTNPSASAGGTTAAGAGFGQVLVQVLGGASVGSTSGGALPDLTQLLTGLLAALPDSDQPSDAASSTPEALNALLNRTSEQPELLEQMLGNEEVQAWMVQASMLLEAMKFLPEQGLLHTAASQQELDAVDTQAAPAVSLAQAQDILKAFAQAVSASTGNVFLGQLQEKLAVILTNHPEFALTKPVKESKKNSGQGELQEAGEAKRLDVQGTDRSSAKQVERHSLSSQSLDAKGLVHLQELNAKVHPAPAGSNASRLQILAAKSMLTNRPELMNGTLEQAAADQSTTTESLDGNTLPLTFAQELNRLAPSRAVLPADGMVRAESFVEDMGEFLMGRLKLQNGNGLTEARLTLNPETLGQVEVKLSMQNGQLVAQFAAHTAMGKDMLESQLSQLRTALQNQGIQVEKLEVTQSPSLQSGMFQDQRHQQQQSQQFGRNGQSDRKTDGNEDYAVEASAILNGRKDQEQEGFDVTA